MTRQVKRPCTSKDPAHQNHTTLTIRLTRNPTCPNRWGSYERCRFIGGWRRTKGHNHSSHNQLNDYLASIGESIWKETSISSKLIFKVSDVVKNIITGKTPSTKNPEYYGRTYPFITIPDMHSSIWICSSERYLSESGNAIQIKKLVPRGSVLISCIATVGLVGIT